MGIDIIYPTLFHVGYIFEHTAFGDEDGELNITTEGGIGGHICLMPDSSKVGIRITSPSTTLHVLGDNTDGHLDLITFDATTSSPVDNDFYDIIFNHENDNDEQEDFAQIRLIATDVSDGTESRTLLFIVADGVDRSMDETMYITAGRMVGIGGINPTTHALEISSRLAATDDT